MEINEEEKALMDAESMESCDSYFKARPQIDCIDRRRVFEAGFSKGYEKAQSRVGELRAEVESLESKITRFGASLKSCDIRHETDHLALCDRQSELIAQLTSSVDLAKVALTECAAFKSQPESVQQIVEDTMKVLSKPIKL